MVPRLFIYLTLLTTTSLAPAQTVREESIPPTTTDPAITLALAAHRVAFATDLPHQGKLFIYLHGAGGTAGGGTQLLRTAALQGFHAIGITYPMDTLPSQVCPPGNAPCFEAVRTEILEGTDASPHVTISRPNCVENRIIRLLQHLNTVHPGEGWGTYLSGETIQWQSIVIYGHSMGGSNTALLARRHELAGACISAPAADINLWWPAVPAATPADRIFGFSHVQDRFTQLQTVWQTMGLTQFGPIIDVATATPPYACTHTLSTTLEPALPGDYHNSTTSDASTPRDASGIPLYRPVWSYMMLGGCAPTPPCPADWNNDNQVDSTDISAFLTAWLASMQGGTLAADFNTDGAVNSSDISAFLTAWLATVQGGC